MRKNICCDTDFYKITHWLQRQSNINKWYMYAEPRLGGKYPEVCFFGLQVALMEHLVNARVTKEMITEAEEENYMTGGKNEYFNREAWERVMNLGYFPLEIKAVPEGTIVPEGNVTHTIESTEPWFANMIGHFEDILMWPWYSTAVATRSMKIKKAITPFYQETSDNLDNLPYALNDFGLRGGEFYEAAAIGGMAHLIHFDGSDNMPASRLLKDFYSYTGKAKSVWATEHSVALSFGPGRGEVDYVLHQLSQFHMMPKSIVIDTYDADNFMLNVVGHEEVKAAIRNHPGRKIWRPDSGVAIRNLAKYSDMLTQHFGFSMNTKGFRVLNENNGFIQGDNINEESAPQLYSDYTKIGWSADNLVLGSGGGLLEEGLTRDTSRWAIKPSYGEKDGVPFNMQKTPKTDPTKNSKSGRLKLHTSMNKFMTIESSKESAAQFAGYTDSLKTVYKNGEFFPITFNEVINNAKCV
jgi:nicotinamide phosphoribosyltransferase